MVPKMADEADPDKVLEVKAAASGRLIGLPHIGLSGNLEVLIFILQEKGESRGENQL